MQQRAQFEQPTYAKWKATHQRQAEKSPSQYKAKKDTRKAYHWVVLTYLNYQQALINVEQPTWWKGKGGRPTAFGRLLSAWRSHGKFCFLVEARNRRSKDTYLVVFSPDGTFLTAYSKTRDDIPERLYPLGRRRAGQLLKLSAAVGDSPARRITDDAILECIPSRKPDKIERAFLCYVNHVIPDAVECGVVEKRGSAYYFSKNPKETESLIHQLNPVGWEDFAWNQHTSGPRRGPARGRLV